MFERLRWGESARCAHCACAGRSYLLAARGTRRVWKCGACRRQYSVLVGTIFERSRVPLATWVDVVSGRHPDAASVARRCGVTPETARFMLRRIATAEREAVRPVVGGAHRRLAQLLAISPGAAAVVRRRSASRPRPRRQVGPSADYGC